MNDDVIAHHTPTVRGELPCKIYSWLSMFCKIKFGISFAGGRIFCFQLELSLKGIKDFVLVVGGDERKFQRLLIWQKEVRYCHHCSLLLLHLLVLWWGAKVVRREMVLFYCAINFGKGILNICKTKKSKSLQKTKASKSSWRGNDFFKELNIEFK